MTAICKVGLFRNYHYDAKQGTLVFQELRKIGFCDYQNVFSRNQEKVNFKVPPV